MKQRGGHRPKQYGTRKEREYANLLRSEGYVVERSGGSLGPFDLIAIKLNESPHSLWVQVKAGKRSYVRSAWKKWEYPNLPPCHIVRFAYWVREERCWYEQDGDGEPIRRTAGK